VTIIEVKSQSNSRENMVKRLRLILIRP